MKKYLLLLLLPFMSFAQTNIVDQSNANTQINNKGGFGVAKVVLLPIGNHDPLFEFTRYKSRIQYNDSGNFIEYHNGTSWNRLVDVSYGSTAYKPFSYTPSWSEVTGKPTLATVATSGSYNDLVNKPTIPSYTAGTGISLASGVFTNTSPDQTVSITGTNGITSSGTYPNFTITKKRQETYSGTTIASGTYTVTFATAYSVAPNIQANIINGTDSQNIRTTSITTTGFTVLVRNRVDVVGLLPSWNNVSGATVDVLVTEK